MDEGCLTLFVAAIAGKAITYGVLFWACSIPCVSPAGGHRLGRAVSAGAARTCAGLLMTPLLFMLLARTSANDWFLEPVHWMLRLALWVATALFIYRDAPFHSRAYRLYFMTCVAVFGLALNWGWDRIFSDVLGRIRFGC